MRIDILQPTDWPAVRAIYEAGIATGDSTFDTEAPSWEIWDETHLREHRLVARDAAGEVVGWAALSPLSDRCCYSGVVEHSLYVAPGHWRRGIGRRLLEALIASTEAAGVWTIQTGVFPENEASVALHLRCGFRTVGRRERLGKLDGRWRDVLLLERRSPVVQ